MKRQILATLNLHEHLERKQQNQFFSSPVINTSCHFINSLIKLIPKIVNIFILIMI